MVSIVNDEVILHPIPLGQVIAHGERVVVRCELSRHASFARMFPQPREGRCRWANKEAVENFIRDNLNLLGPGPNFFELECERGEEGKVAYAYLGDENRFRVVEFPLDFIQIWGANDGVLIFRLQ